MRQAPIKMSAELRILQVAPSLETGGVERTTIEVAEAITAAGGKALVASAGGRLEQQLAEAGGELVRMPLTSKNPLTILANATRLTHLALTRGVKLIHARSRAPGWSALMAARRTGLPFVTTYHGIYSANGPLKRYYNSVMAKGDLVIANSEFTRNHILSMHETDPAKVIAIPRGVDVAAFDPAAVSPIRAQSKRADWAMPEGRMIALVLARLTKWKGQRLLVDAAEIVERASPGRLAYVLAGDAQGRDSYVEELDAAIAEKGLTGIIKRVGHVSDVPAALAAADMAIFPPIDLEAFGRGAIEAQAMGVSVIAADQGGLSETITDRETGLLFQMGDARALADAILAMLAMSDSERKAMAAAGQARVRRCYSKQALQHATLDIYRRLLQNGDS